MENTGFDRKSARELKEETQEVLKTIFDHFIFASDLVYANRVSMTILWQSIPKPQTRRMRQSKSICPGRACTAGRANLNLRG
jgi:hypothetical protein